MLDKVSIHADVYDAMMLTDVFMLLCAQVGDVLVERTVAEVKPAVQGNKEQLDMVRFTPLNVLSVGFSNTPRLRSRHMTSTPPAVLCSSAACRQTRALQQLAIFLASSSDWRRSAGLTLASGNQVAEQLVKQLDTKKRELADFQEKYKIRIRVGASPFHDFVCSKTAHAHTCAIQDARLIFPEDLTQGPRLVNF